MQLTGPQYVKTLNVPWRDKVDHRTLYQFVRRDKGAQQLRLFEVMTASRSRGGAR